MSCWEESIWSYTWVKCRCQILTNIYKVVIELIDNFIFVGVGFSRIQKLKHVFLQQAAFQGQKHPLVYQHLVWEQAFPKFLT